MADQLNPDYNPDTENYYNLQYGNNDGEIRFGHIHTTTSGFKGECISDVMLQGSDKIHYMTMDKNGQRPGWTTNRCPGVYQIKCGDNRGGKEPAMILEALNGDIVIKATNGRIRMEALDFDLNVHGPSNDRGVVNIVSNEAVNIKTKNLSLDGKASVRFVSSGTFQVSAQTSLKFYAGVYKFLGAQSASKPSKLGGEDTSELVANRGSEKPENAFPPKPSIPSFQQGLGGFPFKFPF